MENRIELPQKIENRITIQSRSTTFRHMSKIIENKISKRYWHMQVYYYVIHNSQELQGSYTGPLPPKKGWSFSLLELLLRF